MRPRFLPIGLLGKKQDDRCHGPACGSFYQEELNYTFFIYLSSSWVITLLESHADYNTVGLDTELIPHPVDLLKTDIVDF